MTDRTSKRLLAKLEAVEILVQTEEAIEENAVAQLEILRMTAQDSKLKERLKDMKQTQLMMENDANVREKRILRIQSEKNASEKKGFSYVLF